MRRNGLLIMGEKIDNGGKISVARSVLPHGNGGGENEQTPELLSGRILLVQLYRSFSTGRGC